MFNRNSCWYRVLFIRTSINFTLPQYIASMLIAVVIRNVMDKERLYVPFNEINIVGGIALSLFLSMALMTF